MKTRTYTDVSSQEAGSSSVFAKTSDGKVRLSVVSGISVEALEKHDLVAFCVREKDSSKFFQGVVHPAVAVMFAKALFDSAAELLKDSHGTNID